MIKVLTNGCFDVIHPGHLNMLKHCASLGDHLLVCIDADQRVKKLKGKNRPINSEDVRKFILLNFKWVNDVVIFNSDEELTEMVRCYDPDYMVVGSDYKNKKVIGSEHAKKLIFFEKTNEHSTTKTIENIINRR